MLNFAYAEALELQGKYSEVHPIYESFLRTLREQLEALESRQLPVAASSSSSSDSLEGQDNAGEAVTGVIVTHRSASSASSNMLADPQRAAKSPPTLTDPEFVNKRTDYGVAWIMYIRFARRAEGLKSARALFGKARRDRLAPWQVHEAEGMLHPTAPLWLEL